MSKPFISKVIINNYRNFLHEEIKMGPKAVIIGENAIGKTNFIKALQLVFDPSLSDEDRKLSESDFNDTIKRPIDDDIKIEINVFIKGLDIKKATLSNFHDAYIGDEDDTGIYKFTYMFYKEYGDYKYKIYMGNDEKNNFSYVDRQYLNIKVINALRDVESEMRNSKKSPLNKIVSRYKIKESIIQEIIDNYSESGSKLLEVDELVDIKSRLSNQAHSFLGEDILKEIDLNLIDMDINKIFKSLKVVLDGRGIEDTSLGMDNILYILLVLQLIYEDTIPTFIAPDKYEKICELEGHEIIEKCYETTNSGNYLLKKELLPEDLESLNTFSLENIDTITNTSVLTMLILEEPESHIHPSLQRILYDNLFLKMDDPIIVTTHSTQLASICELKSIIHFKKKNRDKRTSCYSCLDIDKEITDNLEIEDLQRYIDVNRGDIFFGKGVILVEGITEEFMISKFALSLGIDFNQKGIIVCNIEGTNFYPYVKLLSKIGIPHVVLTDGDVSNDRTGYIRMKELIGKVYKETFEASDTSKLPKIFERYGIFVGEKTFEIDYFVSNISNNALLNAVKEIYKSLSGVGDVGIENFNKVVDDKKQDKFLKYIENNIGKGRFAQRLSTKKDVIIQTDIPEYIKSALIKITNLVDENE